MAQDPDKPPPDVWMRSVRWHTYEGVPQPEGSYYLAHEPMVETIETVLKFAVRDTAPPKAVRAPVVSAPVPTAPAPASPPFISVTAHRPAARAPMLEKPPSPPPAPKKALPLPEPKKPVPAPKKLPVPVVKKRR